MRGLNPFLKQGRPGGTVTASDQRTQLAEDN